MASEELITKIGIFETGSKDNFGASYKDDRLLSFRNKDLTKLEVREGTKIICDRAFYDNKTIEEVVLPDSIRAIGDSAFADCKSLENVNIPEGVTEIKASTFRDCNSLHTLELPVSCTKIAKWVFGDGLETLICNAPSMQIDKNAFMNCKTLKTVKIPEGCINAYAQAFLPIGIMPYFEEIKEELVPGETNETSNSPGDTIFEEKNENQENNLLIQSEELPMGEKKDIKSLFEQTMLEIDKIESSDSPIIAYPLHKLGDGFDEENKIKEFADDGYSIFFLLSDGNGNFRACRHYSWDEIQEEYLESEDFTEVFYAYYDSEVVSKKAKDLIAQDWPSEDLGPLEAVIAKINEDVDDTFGSDIQFPPIDIQFFYNRDIILEFTL